MRQSQSYSERSVEVDDYRPGTYFVKRREMEFLKHFRWVDLFVGAFALGTVFLLTNLNSLPMGLNDFLALRITIKNCLLVLVFAVFWLQIFSRYGLYTPQRIKSRRHEFTVILKACGLASLAALLFPLSSISGAFSFQAIGFFFIATTLGTLGTRRAVRAWQTHTLMRTNNFRYVIIVGSGKFALDIANEIESSPESGNVLLGFVDTYNRSSSVEVGRKMLGTLNMLESIIVDQVVDEVLIALPLHKFHQEIQKIIEVCEKVGVQSRYFYDGFQLSLARPFYEQVEKIGVVTLKMVQDDSRLLIKRAVDLVCAASGLILVSPLLGLVAIAIKMTSPGPVIFKQERYGKNRRRFRMYKFRTMVSDAEMLQAQLEEKNEALGPVFKIKDDPRITKLGKLLRKTSLDELPQLFNVVLGQMSLVGPRPLPLRDVSRFSEGGLMRRFSVKPGLTCLWQISGRSDIGFDRWIELDLKYIDEWSLGLDMQILAKTVPIVFKGSGAC